MSRYPKSGDHSQELAIALVKQDLPATSDDPPEAPPTKKSKPDDDANDGAPLMCQHQEPPLRCPLGRMDLVFGVVLDICQVYVYFSK